MRIKRTRILTIIPIIAIGIGLLIMNKNSSEETKEIISKISSQAGGRGQSFTLGSPDSGSDLSTMYDYAGRDGYTFCAAYNWQIARLENYQRGSYPMIEGGVRNGQQETTYDLYKTTDLAQSVAFAKFYGASDEQIQNLIWASNDWITELKGQSCLAEDHQAAGPYYSSNSFPYGRSYKFAEFVYNILDRNERLNLEATPLSDSDDSLRIVVNQSNDTYTVGPYKIEFPDYNKRLTHGGYNTKGDLIWDEIVNVNSNNKFISGKTTAVVSFQDGSSSAATIGNGVGQIQIINGSNQVIKFPKFGETFYIRYKTTKDEPIVEKIKPTIEINYTKKFTNGIGGGSRSVVQAYTYRSSKIRFSFFNTRIMEEWCKWSPEASSHYTSSSQKFKFGENGKEVYILTENGNSNPYAPDLPEGFLDGGNRTGEWIDMQGHVAVPESYRQEVINQIKNNVYEYFTGEQTVSGSKLVDVNVDCEMGFWFNDEWYPDLENIYVEFTREGGEEIYSYYVTTTHEDVSGSATENSETHEISEEEYNEAGGGDHQEDLPDGKRIYWKEVSGHEPYEYNGKIKTPGFNIPGLSEYTLESPVILPYPSNDEEEHDPSNDEEEHDSSNDEEEHDSSNDEEGHAEVCKALSKYTMHRLYHGFEFLEGKVEEDTDKIQPAVVIDIPIINTTEESEDGESVTFGCKEFNMYYSGNVWQDMPTETIGEARGRRDGRSISMAGIQVDLWDNTKNYLVARTSTNSQGRYGFQKLNPLHKYRVIFTYDGMRFQSTVYNNNLSGGYSLAREDIYNVSVNRNDFNDRFDTIESSPQNYSNESGWWGNSKKSYGLYTKIEKSDGTYIRYDGNSGINAGAFRYYDALQIFKNLSTNSQNFDNSNERTMNNSYYKIGTGIGGNCRYYNQINFSYSNVERNFKEELRKIGVDETEINRIWTFIIDTLIQSSSNPYPEQNQFVLEDVDKPSYGRVLDVEYLYTPSRDQSRNVDVGLMLRNNADLWLSKDVYKATVLVNGKQHEYYYNTKDVEKDSSGNWYTNNQGTYDFTQGSDAQNRAENPQYNGKETYTRKIRISEYLYDGSDAGTTDAKNLQVFVTYKIAIKNQSQAIWSSINEIVDYYDEDQYLTPIDLNNSTIIKNNTYVGDSNGNRIYDLNISDKSIYINKYLGNNDDAKYRSYNQNTYNINELYGYKAIYLTGIKSVSNDNIGNSILGPGETTYVYLTFKVKNDETGKIKLDQNINDLLDGKEQIRMAVGKRNIAEINGYSTYYDKKGTKAGVIDVDSNPGSFKGENDRNGNSNSPDLDEDGNIIASSNSWENRLEDDGDKSKNLQLVIDSSGGGPGDDPNPDDSMRSISGYVYEDARTEVSNGAVIGNGVFNEKDEDFEGNSDKKVNGVTIELVELVQRVDSEGFPVGVYEKEKVWSTVEYVKEGNEWKEKLEDTTRYYSGTNKSRVILSGEGAFKVNPSNLPEGEGMYKYESLPPGDFFIRFTYGDTTQTVLTNVSNDSDKVQETLNKLTEKEKQDFVAGAQNTGILGTRGLNSKSYTGQDYKSTIYQKNVDQRSDRNYYNGIVGYTDISRQNYNRNNVEDKKAMYNYSEFLSNENATAIDKNGNIIIGENGQALKVGAGISDAKDVYAYREDEQSYSKGSTSTLSEGIQTLKNHRAEVLSSGTELVTRAEKYMEENRTIEAAYYQREAIKELIDNTKMVAQTGIINTEVEYNREMSQYGESLTYQLKDIDLGLTERPRAQLMISKELENIQIKLANGQILFDTNQSVNNLYYGKHKAFNLEEYYNIQIDADNNPGYRLRHSLSQAEKERKEELISITMDEELIVGATIRLKYKITVDNIGEIDFLDKNFYYLGKTSNTNWENVSKTNARTAMDFVTNELNYESNYQDDVSNWQVVTADILLQTQADKIEKEALEANGTNTKENEYRVTEDNDYINSYYRNNLDTYNILLITNKLSGDLLPRALETDEENLTNSRKEMNLILSTLLNNTLNNENLIYTNLIEIIETSNTNGRRMELSRAGEQVMPYQSKDKKDDDSIKWIKPKGPMADSAQKVIISIPEGENKNFTRTIIIALSAIGLIVGAIVLIKNKVLKD